MRNLVQYPITKDEVLNYLKNLQVEAIADRAIGSLEPVIIKEIMNMAEEHYRKVEEQQAVLSWIATNMQDTAL